MLETNSHSDVAYLIILEPIKWTIPFFAYWSDGDFI